MRNIICAIILSVPLAACAAHPMPPAVSVDDIMRHQYAAEEAHGAMTGTESSVIYDAYVAKIATANARIGASAPSDPITGNDVMR
jgi:hypothetical protein